MSNSVKVINVLEGSYLNFDLKKFIKNSTTIPREIEEGDCKLSHDDKILVKYSNKKSGFLVEYSFVGRLRNHNNINLPSILFYGLDRDLRFIGIKYYRKGDLKNYFVDRVITDEDINNIIRSVKNALSYINFLGFVHNDIKPSNIMMDESLKLENCKLIDFETVSRKNYVFSHAVGTYKYMSLRMIKEHIGTMCGDYYSLCYSIQDIIDRTHCDISKNKRIKYKETFKPTNPVLKEFFDSIETLPPVY